MSEYLFCSAGESDALRIASQQLLQYGFPVFSKPSPAITHLLLPVPSFDGKGLIKGNIESESLFNQLSPSVTVCGGNLDVPFLQKYKTIDLLKDEHYLASNAAITAECTLKVITEHLHRTISSSRVLILGWGRIGKHLAALLKNLGADITVAARKESDRALLHSFGYGTCSFDCLPQILSHYHIIINTVPKVVMDASKVSLCRPDCLKIDLASVQGILADDVIWARGLPGKFAPESSGRLIAQTIIRLCNLKEV